MTADMAVGRLDRVLRFCANFDRYERAHAVLGLDTNISKNTLNFFLETLIKIPKFLIWAFGS